MGTSIGSAGEIGKNISEVVKTQGKNAAETIAESAKGVASEVAATSPNKMEMYKAFQAYQAQQAKIAQEIMAKRAAQEAAAKAAEEAAKNATAGVAGATKGIATDVVKDTSKKAAETTALVVRPSSALQPKANGTLEVVKKKGKGFLDMLKKYLWNPIAAHPKIAAAIAATVAIVGGTAYVISGDKTEEGQPQQQVAATNVNPDTVAKAEEAETQQV